MREWILKQHMGLYHKKTVGEVERTHFVHV